MAQSGRRLRVLIVEDESLVAMLVEDMLMELGHEIVAVAGRLDDAVANAREAEFDIAIVDLNLNGQRTDAVAEILADRRVPFVFATGYGFAGVRAEWAHTPVVQKPFQASELGQAIEAALQASGNRGA